LIFWDNISSFYGSKSIDWRTKMLNSKKLLLFFTKLRSTILSIKQYTLISSVQALIFYVPTKLCFLPCTLCNLFQGTFSSRNGWFPCGLMDMGDSVTFQKDSSRGVFYSIPISTELKVLTVKFPTLCFSVVGWQEYSCECSSKK
jgi:hypothetical protein